jgi:hypothetical protein
MFRQRHRKHGDAVASESCSSDEPVATSVRIKKSTNINVHPSGGGGGDDGSDWKSWLFDPISIEGIVFFRIIWGLCDVRQFNKCRSALFGH